MIIQATGIEKRFGQLQVLKGIDFSAGEGEIVSIMGASGAGKSTLLQILGTLSTPDKGSLTIAGRTVFSEGRLTLSQTELSAWRNSRLGFVFQFHHLLPEFTALENVMIPALIGSTRGAEPALRRSDRAIRSEAEALLAEMGLKDRTGHKPSELSGGEQSRVAIARALINHPSILLADEPSGNLDSATKKEIHQLFLDLRTRHGQSIVIVTHDPALAALCDRTLQMRDGLFENNE